MNDLTKALLKDLQEDLTSIKNLQSNIEVVWALNKLKQNIDICIPVINKIREQKQ